VIEDAALAHGARYRGRVRAASVTQQASVFIPGRTLVRWVVAARSRRTTMRLQNGSRPDGNWRPRHRAGIDRWTV